MRKGKEETFIDREVDLELIDRPQRVSRFDIPEGEIEELAASIEERGLLQAITVVERSGRFEVVFGHRRYLAHKKLGLKSIRCVVRELSEKGIAIDRATENNQRANLSPVEEAAELVNLHEVHKMTWDQIGKMLGKKAGTLKRRAMVVRMDEDVQRALHERKIAITIAEELSRCPDGSHRGYLLEMCIEHGVTKEVVRGWVNDFLGQLRRDTFTGDEGREDVEVYVEEKNYKECKLCKEPVDLMKMKNLNMCPECFEAILKIVRGEGG